MKIRTVLVLAVLAGVASPAWADFYVVQDVKTKKCTIVDKAPTTTTTVTRVGPMAFKTREEATSGMAKEKICVEK
jgi:Tfp pilus assembly protein PilE